MMGILILIILLAINFLFARSIGLKEGEEAMRKSAHKAGIQLSEKKHIPTAVD